MSNQSGVASSSSTPTIEYLKCTHKKRKFLLKGVDENAIPVEIRCCYECSQNKCPKKFSVEVLEK